MEQTCAGVADKYGSPWQVETFELLSSSDLLFLEAKLLYNSVLSFPD